MLLFSCRTVHPNGTRLGEGMMILEMSKSMSADNSLSWKPANQESDKPKIYMSPYYRLLGIKKRSKKTIDQK